MRTRNVRILIVHGEVHFRNATRTIEQVILSYGRNGGAITNRRSGRRKVGIQILPVMAIYGSGVQRTPVCCETKRGG